MKRLKLKRYFIILFVFIITVNVCGDGFFKKKFTKKPKSGLYSRRIFQAFNEFFFGNHYDNIHEPGAIAYVKSYWGRWYATAFCISKSYALSAYEPFYELRDKSQDTWIYVNLVHTVNDDYLFSRASSTYNPFTRTFYIGVNRATPHMSYVGAFDDDIFGVAYNICYLTLYERSNFYTLLYNFQADLVPVYVNWRCRGLEAGKDLALGRTCGFGWRWLSRINDPLENMDADCDDAIVQVKHYCRWVPKSWGPLRCGYVSSNKNPYGIEMGNMFTNPGQPNSSHERMNLHGIGSFSSTHRIPNNTFYLKNFYVDICDGNITTWFDAESV